MTRFSKNPNVRIGLVLLLFALVGFQWRVQRIRAQGPNSMRVTAKDAAIPLQGRAETLDTGGKVPGNPQNGIDDLKRIHKLIGIYREQHGGKYPANTPELMRAVNARRQDYGFRTWEEHLRLFRNPDTRYDDNLARMKVTDRLLFVPYIITDKRPDGTLINTPKPKGTRDVLGWTHIYFHQNVRHLRGERSTENPVGSFLVLWEDGEVEKIRYHEHLYPPIGPNKYYIGFPGQAGLPKGTLTYDEFYRKMGWKNGGPRGREGGPGLAYNITIKPKN